MAGSDKEAEFAFDLFSDIAPLLALFGDQFARQFASESLTWVDHLIFAMVPLGILSAITGAIRVQGPRIAKSFIGRGRENRALAEIELMSSTSKEVCELFNGKSIIRVMGKPRIAQILVFPEEYRRLETIYEDNDRAHLDSKAPVNPTEERSCGIHSLKTAASAEGTRNPLMNCVGLSTILSLTQRFITNGDATDYNSYSYTLIMRLINWTKRCIGLSSKGSGNDPQGQTNFDGLGPPNLQLGLSSDQFEKRLIKKGHELFFAALAAVILQTSLIAIATVTVYHGRTRRTISFEPENYGYPCYIVGTVLLCIGIGICSMAIERNTTEFDWKVLPPEKEKGEPMSRQETSPKFKHEKDASPRLIWLQKSQEVNDQTFSGYAILAGPKYHVITSSRVEDIERLHVRNDPNESSETVNQQKTSPTGHTEDRKDTARPENQAAQSDLKWELLTVCAVVMAGLGFVAQFMGLRGLAYPCSIAQLIAILLMAFIRAMIRRRLGRIPSFCPALARYEIDYLATRLVYSQDFRNYHAGIDKNIFLMSQQKADRVLRWRVRTAKDNIGLPFRFNRLHSFKYRSKAATNPAGLTSNGLNAPQQPKIPPTKNLTQEAEPNKEASCRQLVRVRERLGDLCEWQSMALESALSLASSIEAFMETFFPNTYNDNSAIRSGKSMDRLDWAFETVGLPSTVERDDFVIIPVRRIESRWQAEIGRIEAVLSLWMATTEAQAKAAKKAKSDEASKRSGSNLEMANWRRTKAGANLRYRFCRILGDDFEDGALKRDLSWWVDELIADQSDNCDGLNTVAPITEEDKKRKESAPDEGEPLEHENRDTTRHFSKARTEAVDLIIGFNGHKDDFDLRRGCNKSQARELAISDTGLLPTIIAQHLFTSFMWTVAEHLPEDCLRQGFANNEQEVEIEGRHTFDALEFKDTWRRPTLRHRELTKLVREIEKNGLGSYTDIMLCMIPVLSSKDLLPNHVILKLIPPMRHHQGWAATARSYSRLLDTSIQTCPAETFCYSVVVTVMDFLHFACEPYDSFVKPQDELRNELQKLVDLLSSMRFRHILMKLVPVYAIQQRSKQFERIFNLYGTQTGPGHPAGSDRTVTLSIAERRADKQSNVFRNPNVDIDMEFCIAKLGFSKRFRIIYAVLEHEAATPAESLPSSLREKIQPPLRFGAQTAKDVRSPDIFGWSPLHYAALLCDYDFRRWIFRPLRGGEHLLIHQVHDKIKRTPIHVAVTADNGWTLSRMLESMGDEDKKNALNAFGLDEITPLHLATKFGLFDRVKDILDQGSGQTLTHPDFWGREAIHLAASYGHDEIASLLLQEGAQPYSVDEIDMTPMNYLLKGDVDLKDVRKTFNNLANDLPQLEESQKCIDKKRKIFVEFALKKVDFRDRAGQTFLHYAVQHADSGTVRTLMKHGYNLDQADLQGRPALHLAILAGRTEMALFLLRGVDHLVADPSAEDKQKETALMIAARKGHLELVKRLIWRQYSEDSNIVLSENRDEGHSLSDSDRKNGCDPLAKNLEGRTALHIAIANQKHAVAEYLLKIHPLQPDSRDQDGKSLLATACEGGSSAEFVQAIFEQWPMDLNGGDSFWDRTPLSWACERGHQDIVKTLLACKGIDVNKQATTRMKFTPLHWAVMGDNSDIVELLLNSVNIDVNLGKEGGGTSLELAIQQRDIKVVRAFLVHPKIDVQDRLGYLKQFSASSYEDMHEIIPDIFKGISDKDVTDDDLLKLVEMSEDLRDTAPYTEFAQRALNRETTQKRVMPTSLHAAARLGNMRLIETLCTEDIESTVLDEDGWTCIEYAHTYRFEPLGTEFEQFRQTLATHPSLGQRMPLSLETTHQNEGARVSQCSLVGHESCTGYYNIQMLSPNSNESEYTNIRTRRCVPAMTASRKSFYFEVTVRKDSKSKIIGPGFCEKNYHRKFMPGWYDISFGYHSDDGLLYIDHGEQGQNTSPDFGRRGQYGVGDTVGIGLNLETGEGFVTYNGEQREVGDAFKNKKFKGRKMYPCVGFDNTKDGVGLHFEMNLGSSPQLHPFKYTGILP